MTVETHDHPVLPAGSERLLRYRVVDVFARAPLAGNPLAVFLDGAGLTTGQMHAIAREMNLSETVFVGHPRTVGAVASLRIFTPTVELPMAGHPTIGAVAVLLSERYEGADLPSRVTVDLGVGPRTLLVEPPSAARQAPFLWMDQGAVTIVDELIKPLPLAHALGLELDDLRDDLPVQALSVGVPVVIVPLVDERCLTAAHPARAVDYLATHPPARLLYLFTDQPEEPGVDYAARMFGGPAVGITEDPATGGAAGPLAGYLARHNALEEGQEAVIQQGRVMGRPSYLHIRSVRGSVQVGGQVIPVAAGELRVCGADGRER